VKQVGRELGTTNQETYLRDETGGRRFWPGVTRRIDVDAIRPRSRFAVRRGDPPLSPGEPWWPDRAFERKYIKPVQSDRYEQDAWQEPIEAFLVGVSQTTVLAVAKGAMSGVSIGSSVSWKVS
jgi:predicted P-loop ATPase